jgi:hypothetical protein
VSEGETAAAAAQLKDQTKGTHQNSKAFKNSSHTRRVFFSIATTEKKKKKKTKKKKKKKTF